MDYNISPVISLSIVKAESNFNIDARNSNSSASGLAQFIDGTFRGFCIDKYKLANSVEYKNNPYVQVECMVRMISEGGINHWNASRSIWQKEALELP